MGWLDFEKQVKVTFAYLKTSREMGGQAAVSSDPQHSAFSSSTEDTAAAVIRASGFNLDLVQYIAEDSEMNLFKLKNPIIKLSLIYFVLECFCI